MWRAPSRWRDTGFGKSGVDQAEDLCDLIWPGLPVILEIANLEQLRRCPAWKHLLQHLTVIRVRQSFQVPRQPSVELRPARSGSHEVSVHR